jgi:hypothetical protein
MQVIDKSQWGPGPWQTEPDRVEWEHAGLPCLAVRNHFGTWCGYAAVPPGHPLHGQTYHDVDVYVHGGVTYTNRCAGHICHVPKPGEPDDVWWFGFDTGHSGDYSPSMESYQRRFGMVGSPYDHDAAVAAHDWHRPVYRTLTYVFVEVLHLAEQLAGLSQDACARRRVAPDESTQ